MSACMDVSVCLCLCDKARQDGDLAVRGSGRGHDPAFAAEVGALPGRSVVGGGASPHDRPTRSQDVRCERGMRRLTVTHD